MTLKIIGVGFGRTGTNSTYQALNQLGFPCYHMFEVIGNKANKGLLDFGAKWRTRRQACNMTGRRCSPNIARRWTIPAAACGVN